MRTHTRSWQVCFSDQMTSPLRLSDQRISAFSPKLQTLYCQVPCGSMNMLFASRILFMVGYRNLHTSVFSPLICWSKLRTEISVTIYRQWIIILIFFPVRPLCWCYLATALNLLSSSSPAKLVCYIMWTLIKQFISSQCHLLERQTSEISRPVAISY